MATSVMSAAARAAPARIGRVGGLGFRRAVAAVRVPVRSGLPKVAAVRAAPMTTAGKAKKLPKNAGAKAKTRKSASKRFKITASGKVRP